MRHNHTMQVIPRGEMKRIVLVLIILLFLCGTAFGDLGDPTVQAVCRIKLTNGKSVEAFITMGAGGYDGIHPSGFRFEARGQKATHFLTLKFKKLVRDPAGNYKITLKDGSSVAGPALAKPSKVVFLEWDNGEHQQYMERDAVTVVTELPLELYIDPKYEGLRKGSVVTIPLTRIVSIELLSHPSKKWLDHIKERREIFSESSEPYEDYQEPEWYHEILKNKEAYDRVKSAIDINLKTAK